MNRIYHQNRKTTYDIYIRFEDSNIKLLNLSLHFICDVSYI